ncbi:MAG: DNA cytosine methyltransferase [Candidatus Thermoplasmatota archaeon]|jgi:DNA (cytosine-5)-methyltransferase 1
MAKVAQLAPSGIRPLTRTEEYLALLRDLKPNRKNGLTAVDGWAGAGGLSLGFEAAGFAVTGYERDADACETYTRNLKGDCHQVTIDDETEFQACDVFVAGPPCQPFSVIGQQRGRTDSRDGFPAFVSAVKRLRPRAWLFENVPNILGRHQEYLDELVGRLERLGYYATPFIISAADCGVPQARRRLVVVGTKTPFELPPLPGVSVSAGVALGGLASRVLDASLHLTSSQLAYIRRYEEKSKCAPRDLHLDRPARTLTCRNLGGSTSDMQRILLPDGRRRRLTVAEAARLQSFPTGFKFSGSSISQMAQVGNAVPPLVSLWLAKAVANHLLPAQ